MTKDGSGSLSDGRLRRVPSLLVALGETGAAFLRSSFRPVKQTPPFLRSFVLPMNQAPTRDLAGRAA
jgi:hypothetical protein